MANIEKISMIIRYALLVAAQEDDPYDRQLGPIHLIKYVYLTDMAFAKFNAGNSFTGVDWTFHNFGPWSPLVHDQVELSLSAWGARKTTLTSKFGNEDYTRWSIDFEPELYTELQAQMPVEIRHAINAYVHRFTSDTSSLLHFVYSTMPMLKAAPGEHLDFSVMAAGQKREAPGDFTPMLSRLSRQKTESLRRRMSELRTRFRQKMQQKRTPLTPAPSIDPHNEVFAQGVAWLNKLAGADFPEDGTEVRFADEVWKSEARSGDACVS